MKRRQPASARFARGPVLASLGLLAVVSFAVLAQSPPHWESVGLVIDCTSQCHVAHNSPDLTQAADNVNLCQSCHVTDGLAGDLPISDADKADRVNRTGTSHAFDELAVNTDLDTQLPLNNDMKLRVKCTTDPCPDEATRAAEGRLVCSTCHNQHESLQSFGGDSRIGNTRMLTARGSPDGVAAGGTFDGPEGLWYLVEIAAGGDQNNALFGFSKDNGLSWFPIDCNPGAALPGDPWQNTSGCPVADGSNPVGLDNGVTVTFATGTYVARDRWEFSAAWPFLRAELEDLDGDLSGSVMCRDCHRQWDMDHTAVETYTGTARSHPVGVGLNVNGRGFDRAVPLDGNGLAQNDPGPADVDGNPTNDLLFDRNGNVQCLTCHGVHYVDTNTQTADMP